MKLVSVNVGQPRDVTWKGKTVTTGIFKTPVAGAVKLRKHNLDGDRQADLSVHGGPTKAGYAYPAEHYAYWRDVLGNGDLSWGAFGENFTVEGLDEETVSVGDEFAVGTARVVVTEPRLPCVNAIRFGRSDMVKLFLDSRRTGFYLGVVEEGRVEPGDRVDRLTEHPDRLRVAEVTRLYVDPTNVPLLRKAIAVEALPPKWRSHFAQQLDQLEQ